MARSNQSMERVPERDGVGGEDHAGAPWIPTTFQTLGRVGYTGGQEVGLGVCWALALHLSPANLVGRSPRDWKLELR